MSRRITDIPDITLSTAAMALLSVPVAVGLVVLFTATAKVLRDTHPSQNNFTGGHRHRHPACRKRRLFDHAPVSQVTILQSNDACRL